MTYINKHRFLTELSKFLTFLSDDEREQIITKFGQLFDLSPNEEELAAVLVSPLKVTVELSRAYSKGGLPRALERSEELSGLDLSSANSAAEAQKPGPNTESSVELPETDKEQIEEDSCAEITSNSDEIKISDNADTASDDSEEYIDSAEIQSSESQDIYPDNGDKTDPADDGAGSPVIGSDNSPDYDIYAAIGNAVEGAYESEKESSVLDSETTDKPAADNERASPAYEKLFMPDADNSALNSPIQEQEEIAQNASFDGAEEAEEYIDTEPKEYFDGADAEGESNIATRRVLKPFSLILYIIAAIPVGLAGVAVLLCVAAAFLAGMAAMVGAGVFAMSLAFAGMAMFADIIMTIGVGLVCFAFGVVFLWLTIWFIIRVIGGFVKGIFRLERKWCYKEVAIQ